MRPRRTIVTAAAFGAVAALTVAASAAPIASAVTASPAHSVHPVPASVGHALNVSLSFPPTTDYCLTTFGIHCYSPLQFRTAYGLNPLFSHGDTGRGRTIAVVDSFGSPTIASDLHVFDTTYGLPDPQLQIYQSGAIPPFDPTNGDMVGWAQETTLDVEYAHAFAPGAKILLVETPVAETEGVTGFPEIVAAENFVIDHHMADVISQSFGATEETFPTTQSLLDLRSAFINAAAHGVTMLASSGDDGATNATADGQNLYTTPVNSWPSSDPLVTSVGGTMLDLDANGNRLAPDVVWNDGYGAGGGGFSAIFPRPQFQNGVRQVVGNHRGTPDISMSAAVDGAAIVYYSFVPTSVGYHLFGGTSEASPMFAGIVADAAQLRGRSLGDINPALYLLGRLPARTGIVDVVSGNNSFAGVTGYNAGPGYDLASGLGTINASTFVPALALASLLR
jgi:subtilase family serine protease